MFYFFSQDIYLKKQSQRVSENPYHVFFDWIKLLRRFICTSVKYIKNKCGFFSSQSSEQRYQAFIELFEKTSCSLVSVHFMCNVKIIQVYPCRVWCLIDGKLKYRWTHTLLDSFLGWCGSIQPTSSRPCLTFTKKSSEK